MPQSFDSPALVLSQSWNTMSHRPNELSACEAVTAINDDRLSARDLAESCLERIEARDPEIKAWVARDRNKLLAEADTADALSAATRGPLHGLPVGIKDIFDTRAYPTACGSAIYRDHRPAAGAAAVALLRSGRDRELRDNPVLFLA
ncbi:MAG TPA: amidase family protein [Xanthobacteraceae bacterium]